MGNLTTELIYHLKIDSGSPNTTTADNLKKILAKLNVIASSIQESLQGDPKQLKVKLKDVIVKVACQFETLTKIIALDNSHGKIFFPLEFLKILETSRMQTKNVGLPTRFCFVYGKIRIVQSVS